MWSEDSLICLFVKILFQGKLSNMIKIKLKTQNHDWNFRNLPRPCEEEPHENITSDIGNLEDDDISLSESITDDMATVDDSKKIPLGKPSGILARLRAKKQVKLES